MAQVVVGEVLLSEKYGQYTVEEYVHSGKVLVRFLNTGWAYYTTAASARYLRVKDRAYPSVQGKGYNTLGKFPPKGTETMFEYEAYAKWKDMLTRCYSAKFLARNPTYSEVTVCDSWLDFKNFHTWYFSVRKPFMDSGGNLDKDLLHDYEVKEYSPQNCNLVPSEINRLITGCRTRKNVNTLLGVHFQESTGEYRTYCNDSEGVRTNLGLYPTEKEAFKVYFNFKNKTVREVAEKYKKVLSETLYVKLANYETTERRNDGIY